MPGSNGNSTYENVVGFGQPDNVSSPSPRAVAAAPPASSSSNISVPGIAGFGLSLLNNLFQIGTNRANRKFAAEQAALANQWNLEQWNRENAYNSPSAQMQRYIDAGLNPNLVVGNQNLAASSPTMVSGKDAPAGVAPRIDPLVSAQIRNLDAQSNALESQSKLSDAEAANILGETPMSKAEIAHVNQLTANLVQQYNTAKPNEMIQSGLVKYLNDKGQYSVTVVGPDGQESTYISSVSRLQTAVREQFDVLFSNEHLADAMAQLYIQQVFTEQHKPDVLDAQVKEINALAAKYGYEAKDLMKFLNVADDYYRGLSDMATAEAALSKGDRAFYEKFGSRAMFNAVSGAARNMINFFSGIRKKGSITINNN